MTDVTGSRYNNQMRGNLLYLILSALMTIVVEQSAFGADNLITLHFPKVGVGKLTVYKDATQRSVIHSGPAMGNLSIAQGSALGLKINYEGSLDLSFLAKMGSSNLVALDLAKFPIEVMQFAYLRPLSSLRRLDAQETDLGDGGMQSIGKLNSLEHLDISRTLVTAKGFREISHLTNLVDLLATSIKLDDDCIASLTSDKIRFLRLGATCIGDKALVHLAKLKTLDTLHLARTPVTDKGMARVLFACRGIEELDLADTNVSIRLLPSITSLPHLHKLILSFRDYKPAERLAILKALPRCEVKDASQGRIPIELFQPLH
jgi:hypothetical protein